MLIRINLLALDLYGSFCYSSSRVSPRWFLCTKRFPCRDCCLTSLPRQATSDLVLKRTVFAVNNTTNALSHKRITSDNVTFLMSFIANGYVFKPDFFKGILLAIHCALEQQERFLKIKCWSCYPLVNFWDTGIAQSEVPNLTQNSIKYGVCVENTASFYRTKNPTRANDGKTATLCIHHDS